MITVTQIITTIIPQGEEGQAMAAAVEQGLRDLGTFKSRTDSTTAITIEEEYQMTCGENDDDKQRD